MRTVTRLLPAAALAFGLAACSHGGDRSVEATPAAPATIAVGEPNPATPEPRPEPEPAPVDTDACGASGYQDAIGKPGSALRFPPALNVRLIYPDTMVTRDYRPDRLNVHMTADGVITAIDCG